MVLQSKKALENGIETELIQLPDVTIAPCKLCEGGKCLACMEKGACVFTHDDFHIIFEKIKEASGWTSGIRPTARTRLRVHRKPTNNASTSISSRKSATFR